MTADSIVFVLLSQISDRSDEKWQVLWLLSVSVEEIYVVQILRRERNDLESSEDTMAKAFTYSRLPEHQVAVYYDGSDKAGV